MFTKNHIWKLFYILVIAGFFFFTFLLTNAYKEITQRHHSELRYATNIISNLITSEFQEDDMLLSFIAKEISLHGISSKNKRYIVSMIDNFLVHNPKMVGFVLLNKDTDFILSNHKVSQKLLHFLDDTSEATAKKNFQLALHSKKMILGKVYYSKKLQKWILPLQKSIRDVDDKVIAVMLVGLKIDNSARLSRIYAEKKRYIAVLKDFNLFDQLSLEYYSKPDADLYKLYTQPLNKQNISKVAKSIEKKYGYTLNDLRENEQTISYEMQNREGNDLIFALKYNQAYRYWVLIEGSKEGVLSEFFKVLYRYIAVFVVVTFILYLLFKKIVSDEENKKAELIYQTEHDSFTKLPNRTYLYKHIEEWEKRYPQGYYIFYIDLDNFKYINDKYGHTFGDKIIIEVAKRLQQHCFSSEMLVRQGGDEFLILKPIENLEEITKYLESLIDEEHKEYKINNQKFRISFSIGVVKCPKNVKTIDELLSMADIAMYDAKKRKNSYSFYDEELQRDVLLKADIEQELRGAIKNNEIWIVYQPQIYANNQKIYGVEALVRWENKRLGFVGPDKFISVAEKSGLIVELGEYIFRKSLEEIAALKSELGVDFRLSINISVAQFMQKEFLKRCLKIINEYEFDKKSLTFEVTESMMIEQTDKVLPILNAIKEEGIEISMDDFGTGYSSLSTLHALPIDELKIDKSFIDVILSDTKEELLVESIINIGKNFNMKTLAEGVEDLQQLQKLQELSCDIIQGYYFSKPLKIAALKEYIQER